MSPPLIVPIYACDVAIVDDRLPGSGMGEAERALSFEPFALGESEPWADGHCVTVRTGKPSPLYRMEVAGGELFRTERGVLLVRRPKGKDKTEVLGAWELLALARVRDAGVRSLGVYPDSPPVVLPEVVAAPPAEPEPKPAIKHVGRGITVEKGPPPVGPIPKRTQLSFLDELEVAS